MRRTILLLLTLCASLSASVTVETTPKYVELRGEGWSYRYGASLNLPSKAILVTVGTKHAWLGRSHWLRLIDQKTGNVLGRWRMPGEILALSPLDATRIRVTTTISPFNAAAPKETLDFDPAVQQHAPITIGNVFSLHFAQLEAEFICSKSNPFSGLTTLSAEDAGEALQELQPTLAHDAFSPWLLFTQARLLRQAGAPERAHAAFEAARDNAAADFTDLLPMSAQLETMGEYELAQSFFDAGYRNYLLNRRDARLAFGSLFNLRALYSTGAGRAGPVQMPRPESFERLFAVSPYLTKLWQAVAIDRERAGDSSAAALWQSRAEAKELDWPLSGHTRGNREMNVLIFMFLACCVSLVLFVISRLLIYGPDLYSSEGEAPEFEFLGISRLPFWSRAERFAVLALIAVAWLSLGRMNVIGTSSMTLMSGLGPIGYGTFAGSTTRAWLEKLPDSTERTLALALNADQSGDDPKAERLYAALPDSAVAQNNLGVLLARRGATAEATAAYRKAAQLDAGLVEASFNLSGEPLDHWARLHKRYAPETGMMAVPDGHLIRSLLVGGSAAETRLTLLGPLGFTRDATPVAFLTGRSTNKASFWFWRVVAVLVLLSAVALNLMPYKKPVRAPKSPRRLSLVVPGASAIYGGTGAVIMWLAFAALIVIATRLATGTVFYIDRMLTGSWMYRLSGIPSEIGALADKRLEPAIWPVVLFAIALWTANWFLVHRFRENAPRASAATAPHQ